MAFRSIKYFNPDSSQIDPRVNPATIVTSDHCVLGVCAYPTLKEATSAGINNSIKLIGLLSGYSVNESVAVSTTYEVGNKRQIIVPGKFRGSMGLSSSIIESINLLGSIYETVLEGLNYKYKGIFKKPLTDDILFRPTLHKTYFDNPNNDGTFSNGGLNDQGIELSQYYGIDEEYNPESADAAIPPKEATNKGAILLSLDDLRLRVKFGLAFIMFQGETRIPENSLGYSEIETVSAFGTQNIVENPGRLSDLPGGPLSPINYRILGGQFYENCVILDYNRTVGTEAVGPNINESVSLMYNGTRRLKRDLNQDTGTSTSIPSLPA